MSFASNLKELRLINNLTQKELAKSCGLSPQCISSLEKGINKPTSSTLTAISNYFNCSINDLLENEEINPMERAAGVSETRTVKIVPIEDDLLYYFRKLGKQKGEHAQKFIVDMIEMMTT